ncbi:MAG: DUF5668 domain-containing protein [Parcubacteria group bacterium]
MQNQPNKIDTGPGISRTPLAVGITLILGGIYFLLTQYGVLPNIEKSWPVILVLVGIGLTIGYVLNATQRK